MLSAEHGLIRDLWPEELPKLVTEDRPLDGIPARQVIPPSVEEMFGWACVAADHGKNEQSRTTYSLVHSLPGPNGDAGDVEIEFHLQGFIKSANLHPLGTWKSE